VNDELDVMLGELSVQMVHKHHILQTRNEQKKNEIIEVENQM